MGGRVHADSWGLMRENCLAWSRVQWVFESISYNFEVK